MLVRDVGDAWQVVLQTDHADLCGQFAAAWQPRPEPFRSLEVVARRHDDGWAIWERAPGLDGDGRPRNFLDVQVPSHLAFYRAAIAAVTDHDAYAGLLLSMHGAGIYTGRYGSDPGLGLTRAAEAQEQVDAFVREQESDVPRRVAGLGVGDEERWAGYRLLQLWDRLSLYACLKDLDVGEPGEIGDVRLEPAGPWRVRMRPFPFGDGEARFTLVRRLLPKRRWADDDDFRRDFFAVEPEPVELTVLA